MTEWRAEIRRAMRRRGVTQTELARRLGVSKSRVSHFLNDEVDVRFVTLARVAEVLGCTWRMKLEDDKERRYAKTRTT